MPSTCGREQLIINAPTPICSSSRAARPNASPSGPPQCCPYTPHNTVPTPPEANPHRQTRFQHRSTVGSQLSGSHQRQRLQQDEVRWLVLEDAGDAPTCLLPRAGPRRVRLKATAQWSAGRPPGCLPGETDARRTRPSSGPAPSGSRPTGRPRRAGGDEPPGVGGDDVASGRDVATVHVEDWHTARHEGARAPQPLLLGGPADGAAGQLGRGPAVQDHTALGEQRVGDRRVRRSRCGGGLDAYRFHSRMVAPSGRSRASRAGGLALPKSGERASGRQWTSPGPRRGGGSAAGSARSPPRGWRRAACAGCS